MELDTLNGAGSRDGNPLKLTIILGESILGLARLGKLQTAEMLCLRCKPDHPANQHSIREQYISTARISNDF